MVKGFRRDHKLLIRFYLLQGGVHVQSRPLWLSSVCRAVAAGEDSLHFPLLHSEKHKAWLFACHLHFFCLSTYFSFFFNFSFHLKYFFVLYGRIDQRGDSKQDERGDDMQRRATG